MQSGSLPTHAFGRNQPAPSDDSSIVDYTELPADVPVDGHLSNGSRTDSTARCSKCQRIGLASVVNEGEQLIVHRGRVTGNTLEGIDVCHIRIDKISSRNRA